MEECKYKNIKLTEMKRKHACNSSALVLMVIVAVVKLTKWI
jgi:hypothetical protein